MLSTISFFLITYAFIIQPLTILFIIIVIIYAIARVSIESKSNIFEEMWREKELRKKEQEENRKWLEEFEKRNNIRNK